MTAKDIKCADIVDTEIKIEQSDAPKPDGIQDKLNSLARVDYATLRSEWRRLYRTPPPRRVARDLLMLGVAWKIQERAYGGINAATKRRLNDLTKDMERDGDVTRSRITQLKPGAKLVREWHGDTHTVLVTEDGFQWNSRDWRSLSAIAREITGGHWSGPRFFGLGGNVKRNSAAKAGEPADA